MTEQKSFIEHGPNALPVKVGDGISLFNKTTRRMAVDLRTLVDDTDFEQMTLDEAARIAELALTLARRASTHDPAPQRQPEPSSHAA